MHTFFDRTLRQYAITGKRLAEVTGYSTTHISDFRRGKTNPSCETLQKLLDGADEIAPGAKRYFCQLLGDTGSSPSMDLSLIEGLSSTELAGLLVVVAARLQQSSSNQNISQEHLISA